MNAKRILALILALGAPVCWWTAFQRFEASATLEDEQAKVAAHDPDAAKRLADLFDADPPALTEYQKEQARLLKNLLGAVPPTVTEEHNREARDRYHSGLGAMAHRAADRQHRLGRAWIVGGVAALLVGGTLFLRRDISWRSDLQHLAASPWGAGFGALFGLLFCGFMSIPFTLMATIDPQGEMKFLVISLVGAVTGALIGSFLQRKFLGKNSPGEASKDDNAPPT